MSLVRRATAKDAEEVLRLRQVMIDTLPGGDSSTEWHTESLPSLRERLGEANGDFAAFIVDHPDRTEALAALATRGAGQVMLTASPEAEPLYVCLGFVHKPDPTMILKL
ncbi:hypothetical protein [Streptomyces sp. AS02]|uniref:hypothetical protein n=1 Tax=Streptomyces sp. AS02 TaxID=2938946 RepID=UPI00202267E1|nr:hypothetical protein [Streptomyces sp. AS02]MCL8013335.1 hypothetical protein [Streptomyces sp. AS02]